VVGPVERDGHAIWTAVDRLIDSTPDLSALKANRIHLLAARRWSDLGRQLPAELERDVRRSALVALLVPEVLARVRAACDGLLVLHKGPEIAHRYRDPVLRPYLDVDLLAPDATNAQQALLTAGFVEVGDPDLYTGSPHGRPVEWPGLPLHVEVHEEPNWPSWLGRPPTADLLARAEPSSLGVDGLHTLAPAHHAVIVAVHAWAHGPLAQVRDLVDVAVMSEGLDRGELQELSRRWGVQGLWQTTIGASDAVLFGAPKPPALRMWARNLSAVRERTVLETHLARWLSGFSALGARRGARVLATEVAADLRPREDETWAAKLRRSRKALRHALVRKSQHDEGLDERVSHR
jgi:hypothetical protein